QLSALALSDKFHKEKMEKSKMSSEQIQMYYDKIPKRKNLMSAGQMGRKITVFTNMFQIIFNDKFVTNAVHYDVSIRPVKEKPSKAGIEIKLPATLCRKIFEKCRLKHFGRRFPAFDGKKNVYSANDLPFPDNMRDVFSLSVGPDDNMKIKEFEITLKKVANIDLGWIKNLRPGFGSRAQTALQVLDVILRHGPEMMYDHVGRSLFWDIDMNNLLSPSVALGHGGFLSGSLGWKPYVNVDAAHKGFTTNINVLEYICGYVNATERNITYLQIKNNLTKIISFLRGLKVTYAIPNLPTSKRSYRVRDLCLDSCDSHKFAVGDVTYTITRYFREIKKYNIKRTDLPTLHVGNTSNGDKVLVPLELCSIIGGQAINKKLNESETAAMIKKTAMPAYERKRKIEEAFNKLKMNSSSVMEKEFHLSVSSQMQIVDARVLPPPELKYAYGSTSQVSKGIWRCQKFNEPKNLEKEKWTIIELTGHPITHEIQYFLKTLQEIAYQVGMKIEPPMQPFKSLSKFNTNEITTFFNKYCNLKLVIVVIPDNTDQIYGLIKKITEIDVGVLTQCVKFKTVKASNPTTIRNLLQKINSKLNGINHVLNRMPSCLSQCHFMLVGADVTHPAPDSKNIPSIAAVATSRNDSAFQYNVSLRLQPPKEEMILDLEAIILSQLNIYYLETKFLPKRLIYYRDGVSEGQLPQVMFYEINAIRNAIKMFNKGNIEITCLIVQKRHHVRLFPTNPQESDDRNRNVRAGTIVDTTITHPDHIDFYLVSHASIQGTARPTKYRCICNDSQFNEDQLEEMTYFLCHMYARCTRSVSYPAPTYYAHLAAFRGRTLLQGVESFNVTNLENEQKKFILKMGESPMYFV
ncbi:Protein argonaute-2, partial [Cyphomyrmex costatus]